jgi:hypothetical protein
MRMVILKKAIVVPVQIRLQAADIVAFLVHINYTGMPNNRPAVPGEGCGAVLEAITAPTWSHGTVDLLAQTQHNRDLWSEGRICGARFNELAN